MPPMQYILECVYFERRNKKTSNPRREQARDGRTDCACVQPIFFQGCEQGITFK